MRASEEKLKQDASIWIEDFGQMTDVRDDYIDCYVAGFKACEARMVEGAASSFDGFFESIDESEWSRYYDEPDANEVVEKASRKAFTAGRLSGLKEREEIIAEMKLLWRNSRSNYVSPTEREIVQGIKKKYGLELNN